MLAANLVAKLKEAIDNFGSLQEAHSNKVNAKAWPFQYMTRKMVDWITLIRLGLYLLSNEHIQKNWEKG